MSASDITGYVVSIILGGGGMAGINSLYQARGMARKLQAEANSLEGEAEATRTSIVVQGAETAVLSLQRSLEAESKRADRAEAKNVEYEQKVAELKAKLDTLQDALNDTRAELQNLLNATKH